MSLSIGGASTDLTGLDFPGVGHEHVTIGVEIELAIFNLSEDNKHNFLWFPLIRGGLKEIERRLSKPGNAVAFAVKDDGSINTRWKGGLNRGVSVEVATPILLGDQFEWVIPELCAAINKVVDGQDARIDLSPESECGLHVHIGIEERHYTFGELRRIAKAIVIFENVMDFHHAEHRRTYTGGHTYIQSNRTAQDLKGLSITQMVEKIDATTTSAEMLHLINSDPDNSDKYFKYNLTATKRFGTVEFRQAEGSVDDSVIVQWIRNVITFVISAIRTEDEEFPVLAYMAEEGFAWSEDISVYYGLPSPNNQGLPLAPPRDDDSSDEEEEEIDDILPDIAELSIGSGAGADIVPVSGGSEERLRKHDTFKRLNTRLATKIHSYHIREGISNRLHRKNIRERLSARINRALARINRRRFPAA